MYCVPYFEQAAYPRHLSFPLLSAPLRLPPPPTPAHCHAPSCIREEIWNADTGQIICNVSVMYGSEVWGPGQKNVFNEANYVAIPPCIFGNQSGIQDPWVITPDTNITAIKYFNNTFRHLGQMAQWTGMMVRDRTRKRRRER